MLPGRQKVDISSFSEQERELFQKYGKVPSSKGLLANKLKERKYFDSGDYALSKAGGLDPLHSVGTAIPSPADIPHASPPSNPAASTSPGSMGFAGGQSGSPTNGGAGPLANKETQNVGVGHSIGGGGGAGTFGSPSKEPIGTFGGRMH